MTPREQLDGLVGDLRGEMEALRRENAELRAQLAQVATGKSNPAREEGK